MSNHPFPHLFSPITLNHRRLKNRIVFGAHTANMAENGLPSRRTKAYYVERAKGGAAMIVVEPVPAHRSGVLTRGNFRAEDDAIIAPLRKINEACSNHGTVMIQQIYHVGQHGDGANSYHPNWSASGLPSMHDSDGGHKVSEAEIEELIQSFVAAADRARQAGFDGVEIFAAYHSLIDQFWTPWSNRRDDRWGGSLDNRVRFSGEILSRIRETCGPDFIVGLAVSVDQFAEPALSLEALTEIASWHDERGLMDYLTCGTGSYFRNQPIIPTHLHEGLEGAGLADHIKTHLRHARVQAEAGIHSPARGEEIISTGQADLCSMVRAQIADPWLARKAEAGDAASIRPCIHCNQQCIARRYRDYWISCLVNPSVGREWEWRGDKIARSERRRSVMVVGAGPAGLEAARVAAEQGHSVTLLERSHELGGQWRLAARQPTRNRIADHINWYRAELNRLGVEVRLGEEATPLSVRRMHPDHVIVATGIRPVTSGFQRALPMLDCLPGHDEENVISYHAVMEGTTLIGERVLLLDDLHSWRGIGTALHLTATGHDVTIATAKPAVAMELSGTGADGLARARFAREGGRVLTDTALQAWGTPGNEGSAAKLVNLLTGEQFEKHYDTLVLATVAEPDTSFAEGISALGDCPPFDVVGDCNAPRKAHMAIYEGRKAALGIV
jgi:2,4-dienoyl-CoA reductase-like NADH-dependent reductase (Old Yellow Enzyme family)/thioredoxin reductase